ncbi:hypothetical protein [Ulvibacterium sp.]|uniref:hypothetical protein n=1 Tax=Ulvibacterium sp. TaxID=2665914 RepID=UPI003CC57874
MTKTDLFRVVIKTLGIYCFVNSLFQLIPNMSFLDGFYSFSLRVSLIYLVITLLIAYVLLFQTDRLIKLFRLEKGFDEDGIETGNLNENGLFKVGRFKKFEVTIGKPMITNGAVQYEHTYYRIVELETKKKRREMIWVKIETNWFKDTQLEFKPSLSEIKNK